MKDNSIVKYENKQIQRVEKTIAITNKLLAVGTRTQIIELFVRHPDFFKRQISQFYSLSDELIKKYKDEWNYSLLPANESLIWDENLIDLLYNNLDWKSVSRFASLSETIIDSYINCWDWKFLCHNTKLPWSQRFIEKYITFWDWKQLSQSKALPWSSNLIKTFLPYWNWSALCLNVKVPWDEALVEEYILKINWANLCSNPTFPWTEELRKKYIAFKKLDPTQNPLSFLLRFKQNMESLSANPKFPWSKDSITQYSASLNWQKLSFNKGVPWTLDILKLHVEKFDWAGISLNYPNASELISSEFERKVNWAAISFNKSLIPDQKFMTDYYNRIDWNGLFFNLHFIKKHFANIESLFDQHCDQFRWKQIGMNKMLPWSINFIKKYEHKWMRSLGFCNSNYLLQFPHLWNNAFKKHVDDSLIDEVFTQIGFKSEEQVAYNDPFKTINDIMFSTIVGVSEETYLQIMVYINTSISSKHADEIYAHCERIARRNNEEIDDDGFQFLSDLIERRLEGEI